MPDRLPSPYTERELHAIRSALRGRPDVWAACTFLVETGLRVSEFADVTLADVADWPIPRPWCGRACKRHSASLRVIGKGRGGRASGGGKERVIVLSSRALRAAHVLAATRGAKRPETAAERVLGAFQRRGHRPIRVRPNGREAYLMPWTIRGFAWLLQSAGETARVHTHAHRFRTTFASRMIDRGAEPLVVAAMLGHSKLDTTQLYVLISESRQRRELRR